jgi:hypothetical protein
MVRMMQMKSEGEGGHLEACCKNCLPNSENYCFAFLSGYLLVMIRNTGFRRAPFKMPFTGDWKNYGNYVENVTFNGYVCIY